MAYIRLINMAHDWSVCRTPHKYIYYILAQTNNAKYGKIKMALYTINIHGERLIQNCIPLFNLTLIGSWKKLTLTVKGGKNDPKTKIAVTFFLLRDILMKFSEMIEKSSLNTISWIESSKCHVMWRHSVSTWRHEVKELTIHILASRCDRKMILFFVSMVFWVTKFKYVINFEFVWCCDVMTSCHDVTKPDLPISACRCARNWFFFCFHGFLGHWVQKCY